MLRKLFSMVVAFEQGEHILTARTAKADPKDPNADLNTLLGITDK